jgi:hypothetical protein
MKAQDVETVLALIWGVARQEGEDGAFIAAQEAVIGARIQIPELRALGLTLLREVKAAPSVTLDAAKGSV